MPTYAPAPDLGLAAPDFNLPAVDGSHKRLADFKNGAPLVVMFICNHCPYVQAIEDRLIQLALDCKKIGVNVVGICSNDPEDYPEDSFLEMQKRAKLKNYPFPYLHDLSQNVAKSYQAVCTPDFFVYDAELKLRYRGRLDDSWKNPAQVTKRELFEAVTAIAKKEDHPFLALQTPSMGCSIKWRKPNA